MNKKEYFSLCEEIWEHSKLYYLENAPRISDLEFDKLFQKLIQIEKQHPEWIFSGSPTQQVDEGISSHFVVKRHIHPMLSLANTYSAEEVKEFLKRMHKLLHTEKTIFVAELKIDGIAISLCYEQGFFVRGLTRGNGQEGEDITQNLLTISSIPRKLRGDFPELLEARGEVFMPIDSFHALNQKKEKEGEPLFANPRNAAGGSLKLLDSRIVASRHLDFVCHGFAEESNGNIHSHYEGLSQLEKWGIPLIAKRQRCSSFEEIWAFASSVEKKRKELPYEIDGIVIKVDDISTQKNWVQQVKIIDGPLPINFQLSKQRQNYVVSLCK